ncbi:MAG: Polyribonucleotide nucleotidyltransferase [Clostridiales bacterium 38_11]|nr:MAG: Polyribonucleotide nucleotidyltransferase [Clostridiales bacterium 38_11]HBH12878.1 polyribonucleotide nucleotidyltransferase [Clostridiales bacterium]
MEKIYEYELAGRKLSLTFNKFAEFANSACMVRYGDTAVFAVVTASKKPKEGIDYFPLGVFYEEKLYSVGKIPGGFIKREGRPSEKATLASRLIDRPLRPLFPHGFRNDVQVVTTVMSVDQDCSPEIAAMIGASAVLTVSDIPFDGPIGGVNMGLVDNELVVNPNQAQREVSKLDLTVAGTKDAVMMVEAGADIVPEETILEAIMQAHGEIIKICGFIEKIRNEIGKEKSQIEFITPSEEIKNEILAYADERFDDAINSADKQEREEKTELVQSEVKAYFEEKYPDHIKDIKEILYDIIKEKVRTNIVKKGIRPDNRKIDEIRPISCEVGILPRTHGTGLFTRGQTQVLTVATLGVASDIQIIDGISEEDNKSYMHHYNFPGYSVGEPSPIRGPGRREIGHGALAERALIPVLPNKEDFPYTLRLVSEVLSSNGSTSQASVCGSTMSLMDAGVPIKAPVAGIAMGLIKEGDDVVVLTDIQGMEDFLGDMDFKVAGTAEGVTAIQMDMKIHGIDRNIIMQALDQAKAGRLFILDKMNECISEPRKEVSKYAPKIIYMKVHPDKIREIIGAGGKVINKIIEDTGVKIDIEDDGSVMIAAINLEAGLKAKAIIEAIIKDIEVGEMYVGKVVKIMNFGAFIDIGNKKEGLVHISELSKQRVNKVEDVLKEGEEVLVKVIGIDKQGKIKLSRKDALKETETDK